MGICGKGAREGGKTEKRQQHKRTPAAPDLFKSWSNLARSTGDYNKPDAAH